MVNGEFLMKKNLVVIEELKKQGKALLDARRDNFVRQSLLSDEFLNFMQQNKKPFDLLMSYYECAIMEVETKFRVLNHELSLEYDNNPIESIKTRVKSYDSILKKIRRMGANFKAKTIHKKKARAYKAKTITPKKKNGAMHECAVCHRTELDDPELEFRYCSKCDGNYEYCQDHLFTHKHVKR